MKSVPITLWLVARLLALGDAVQVRGGVSSEMAAVQQAEAEDQSFWSSEWAAMDQSLITLASVASSHPSNGSLIPKNINLNPKSAADLLPALGMLKAMYEDGKERIGKLNTREDELKAKYAVKQVEHDTRMARIEARFKNHTLNLEFRTNETRDENRIWNYWARCRERQHHQYHTGLKIQHSTLEKVKKMIDMYEKTLAGKDIPNIKKDLARVSRSTAPMIVLLEETRREVVAFCTSALSELATARAEIKNPTCPQTKMDYSVAADAGGNDIWQDCHYNGQQNECHNIGVGAVKKLKFCGPGELTISRMTCNNHDYKAETIIHKNTEYTTQCEEIDMASTIAGPVGDAPAYWGSFTLKSC